VNVGSLNRFADGTRVDEALLREVGLANGRADGVKILGTGKLERKLTICANGFSASARIQIEALGGVCELAGEAKPV
jgi:large subunit ribosomal protein L15